jgi:hypothetical protein
MRYHHLFHRLPEGGANLICWYLDENGERKGQTLYVEKGKLTKAEREAQFLKMEVQLDRQRGVEAGLIT